MKTLKKAAPWLLAALCLIASGLHFTETMRSFDRSKDMVSSWEEHMKLIRDAIPEDVFIVGYLEPADIPDSTVQHDPAEFFLTQYGIAPVVLTRGFGDEWTIGNFGGNVPLESLSPWLDQRLGKHEVQDLGFGIFIIHDLEN
jgi:hypothetical protein